MTKLDHLTLSKIINLSHLKEKQIRKLNKLFFICLCFTYVHTTLIIYSNNYMLEVINMMNMWDLIRFLLLFLAHDLW